MAELHGIEESPVSFSTVGAGIGMFFGPVGLGAGMLVGAVADVFLGAYAKKKARQQAKKAFMLQLLKRYNTQIFISSLERLGAAMIYAQSLGLKPGSEEFDAFLKKKLFSEIGYKGKCNIDLYGPAPSGQKPPLLATIDRYGKLTPYDPNIDIALGEKWAEACSEVHKAALKMWAEEKAEEILYQREREKESSTAKRNAVTRVLVNGGIIMLMMGYTLRQKKKLKGMRRSKAIAKAAANKSEGSA